MSTDADRRRWAELVDLVNAARAEYYQKDAPRLSDAEYDALYAELVEIERRHPELAGGESPTQTVGGARSEMSPTDVTTRAAPAGSPSRQYSVLLPERHSRS